MDDREQQRKILALGDPVVPDLEHRAVIEAGGLLADQPHRDRCSVGHTVAPISHPRWVY